MSDNMRKHIAEIANKWTGNHPWGVDSEPVLAIEQLLASREKFWLAATVEGIADAITDTIFPTSRDCADFIRNLHPDLNAVLGEYGQKAQVRGLKFAISVAEEESDPEAIIEILQERIAELSDAACKEEK